MRLSACDCRAAHYARLRRSSWMHMVLGRKLYHCHACEAVMLLDPRDVQARRAAEGLSGDAAPADDDRFPETVAQPR